MRELSAREVSVMELLIKGYKRDQVAEKLELARSSVDTYVCRAKRKLGAKTTVEAGVKFAALIPERADA